MRINRSKETYSLIKALSKTEKGYLKKWTLGKSSSKLVKAFDIINSFEVFDDSAISQRLVDSGLEPPDIYKRLLPVLLRSMNQYHSGSTSHIKVLEAIVTSQILLDKRLFGLAIHQIDKGLDIAQEHELFSSWQELIKLRQVAFRLNHEVSTESDIQSHRQALEVAKHQENEIHLEHLYRQLLGLTQVEHISKVVLQQVISEILEHPTMQADLSGSPKNSIYKGRMLSAALYFVGRWEEAYENCLQLLTFMPELKTESVSTNIDRLSVVLNAMEMAIAINDRKGYLQNLSVIEAAQNFISDMPERSQFTLNEGLACAHQADALQSGMLERAIDIGNGYLDKKATPPLRPITRKAVMHAIVLACFYQEEYIKVVRYLNTEFVSEESEFLNDHIRWIELICVYHGSDTSLFDAKWLSMKRRVAKLNLGYEWETQVLKSLRSAYGKPLPEQRKVMHGLHQTLIPFRNEIRVRIAGALDLITWAESQAVGRPMILLIKEQYLK